RRSLSDGIAYSEIHVRWSNAGGPVARPHSDVCVEPGFCDAKPDEDWTRVRTGRRLPRRGRRGAAHDRGPARRSRTATARRSESLAGGVAESTAERSAPLPIGLAAVSAWPRRRSPGEFCPRD